MLEYLAGRSRCHGWLFEIIKAPTTCSKFCSPPKLDGTHLQHFLEHSVPGENMKKPFNLSYDKIFNFPTHFYHHH